MFLIGKVLENHAQGGESLARPQNKDIKYVDNQPAFFLLFLLLDGERYK